jgi:hypothetical protein
VVGPKGLPGQDGRRRGPCPLGGRRLLVDFLVLGANLGEQDGAVLADGRGCAARRGHAGAHSLGRRIKGRRDGRVDGAMRAGPRMTVVEGNLQQGRVEGEFRGRGGLTGGKREAEGDVRCQTVGQDGLALRRGWHDWAGMDALGCNIRGHVGDCVGVGGGGMCGMRLYTAVVCTGLESRSPGCARRQDGAVSSMAPRSVCVERSAAGPLGLEKQRRRGRKEGQRRGVGDE